MTGYESVASSVMHRKAWKPLHSAGKLVSSVMRGKIKRCREAWEKALYSSPLLFLFFIILTRKIKLKNVSRRFDVVKRVQV